MNTLLSVIMPTCNRNFGIITPAIRSVLNQSYENLELLIIDDNNDDEFDLQNQINEIKDCRIKYFKNNNQHGANYARNLGVYQSKGEYVAFIDDDDYWYRNKLEVQLNYLLTQSTDFVFCSFNKRYSDGSLVQHKISSKTLENPVSSLLITNYIGTLSSIMVRKKLLLYIGLFDEQLPASQDYDLYIRLVRNGNFSYVDEPMLDYNIHQGDRISKSTSKKLSARIYLFDKHKDLFETEPATIRKKLFQIAILQRKEINLTTALKTFMKGFKSYKVIDLEMMKYFVKVLFNV